MKVKFINVIIILCLFLFAGRSLVLAQQVDSGYCNLTFSYDIEPITYVEFAGIVHWSSAEVNAWPALEDFTDVITTITPGQPYDIVLKGNTAGNYENYFTVFIDWNQDSLFEENETYHLGSISNSDGQDSVELRQSITAPNVLYPGLVRMRVVKNYNDPIGGPCIAGSYGQAEDYTLLVMESSPLYFLRNSYCKFNIGTDVEPITYVEFGGIRNRTSAAVDSTPGTEDFTSFYTIVYPGDSIEIVLEGNTAGNYTNYFTVMIDWDQNGRYGDPFTEEYYIIGSISNSTGTDSNQIRKYIKIPSDAKPGITHMTVMKDYSNMYYNTMNCVLSGTMIYQRYYGQAEEYGIVVAEPEPETLPEISFAHITPITLVQFPGIYYEATPVIDSTSSELISNGHVLGSASQGDTVSVTLKGNTDGHAIAYFTAYFDWNQNGRLDDTGEEFQLGSITSSTGTDSIQLETTVVIPDSVLSGMIKMRVVMTAEGNISGPYTLNQYGQAIDYTIGLYRKGACQF